MQQIKLYAIKKYNNSIVNKKKEINNIYTNILYNNKKL